MLWRKSKPPQLNAIWPCLTLSERRGHKPSLPAGLLLLHHWGQWCLTHSPAIPLGQLGNGALKCTSWRVFERNLKNHSGTCRVLPQQLVYTAHKKCVDTTVHLFYTHLFSGYILGTIFDHQIITSFWMPQRITLRLPLRICYNLSRAALCLSWGSHSHAGKPYGQLWSSGSLHRILLLL